MLALVKPLAFAAALAAVGAATAAAQADTAPWAVESPGGAGAGFGLGIDAFFERLESLKITQARSEVTLRDLFHGISQTTVTDGDPALLNRKFKIGWKPGDPGAGVQLPIGLPSSRLTHGVRIHPSLIVQAGVAKARLDFLDRPEPDASTGLEGLGVTLGGGLDVAATLCEECGLFAVAGYRFRAFLRSTLDRLQHFEQPGFRVLKDEVRLSRRIHEASLRIGYVFPGNRIAAYAGLLRRDTRVDVDDELRFASEAAGEETSLVSHTRFASLTTQKLAGLDAHLGGPLFARVEATFGDGDRAALLKMVYLWSYRPPRPPLPPPDDDERRIAAAIAPGLARIAADFAAGRKALTVIAGPGGLPAYRASEVDDLLTRTERDILAVLKPYAELEALGDWVQDRFAKVRQELGLPPYLGRAARSSGSPPGPVLLAALGTHRDALQPPSGPLSEQPADSKLDDIQSVLETLRRIPLKMGLWFVNDLGIAAALVIYPRYTPPPDSQGPFSPALQRLAPGGYRPVWRGSYAYVVSGPTRPPPACNWAKPGGGLGDCPLDLVERDFVVLGCKPDQCSERSRPR
jgi:hypothetical protein